MSSVKAMPEVERVGREEKSDLLKKTSANRMKFAGARVVPADLVAILLVVAFAFVLFAKNIFIDNAVVFHDEYIYKVAADKQLAASRVVDRQLAMELPNYLFLEIYGYGSYFGSNYYVFAQLLNVAFWALGLVCLYRVAVCSGLSSGRALIFLGVTALLPFSAYTKYFMPESMYFALFCVSVYMLIRGVRKRSSFSIFFAGSVVGSMYFVKPHALPLILANIFFIACLRDRIRWGAVFGSGALLSIVIGKLIFSTSQRSSPLGLGTYAGAIDPFLAKLQSYFAQPAVLATDLAGGATGHVLYLSALFGLSFVAAFAVLVPKLGLVDRSIDVPSGTRHLSLYLMTGCVVLVGMAVIFTVLVGETGRVHSRYYFFLYPLALLMLFHFPVVRLTLLGKWVGVAVVLVSCAWLVVCGSNFSQILPISLVSDSPEWGFVFFSKFLLYLSVVGLAIAGTFTVIRGRNIGPLIAMIGVISIISSIDVAMKQKGIFRNSFVTGREAIAVEEMVGKEGMARAVVVGQGWDGLSKFLFYLTTAPSAMVLPAGSNLAHVRERFPLASHFIVISEGYELPAQFSCASEVPQVKICGANP